MTYAKGDLVQPGKHNIVNLPVTTAKTITKGNFYRVVAGDTVLLATTTTTAQGVFVALETKVIGAGDVPTTVQGLASGKVVLAIGDVTVPNALVKIETGSGEVVKAASTDIPLGYVVGRYIKVAGASATSDTVDGDLVVVDLGAF